MADALSDDSHLLELFVRLAAGDRTALPPAFRLLHPLIQEFCNRLLGCGADADDATQQTLGRVFEEISAYDATRQPLPWVFAIAAWEVRTIRRRTRRTEQRAAAICVEELVSTTQDPELAAMSSQFLSAVNQLIETLPDLDRATLREALLSELAIGSPATSGATFRKRKQRALHKVRTLLRNLGHIW